MDAVFYFYCPAGGVKIGTIIPAIIVPVSVVLGVLIIGIMVKLAQRKIRHRTFTGKVGAHACLGLLLA